MFRSISKSIMAKLLIQFFLVGIIPLVCMGALTYYLSKDAMKTVAFQNIASINAIRKVQTIEFLKDRVENLTLLSRTQQIRNMINNQIYQEMNPIFSYYMKAFGYSDIILLDAAGQTVYSAAGNMEYDPFSSDIPATADATKKLHEKIMASETPTMTDMVRYKADAEPAIFMGAPVYSDTGELYAVLICQINAARISSLIVDGSNAGAERASRNTYIVGPDSLLRTKNTLLGKDAVLKERADSSIYALATKNTKGTGKSVDAGQKNQLHAYSLVGLQKAFGTDFDWAVVTVVDEGEAFALLTKLKINTFIGMTILVILVAIAGIYQSRMIGRPINELSYRVVKLNNGDFTAEVPLTDPNRSDEIGMLLRTFNEGSKKFRHQMKNLIDATNLLIESISRISTTASQLATSASETSSAISEVTTTVEEVKQTSEVASEKAEYVAQSADATTRISHAGKQATENTMIGIDRIKDEMNAIAESTVQLSAQTKSIEDIINTVADIADQSNILSVNAAIEAAKAGEHGKGFSVVAQEVKSLSTQSKDATNQVREILSDIQKATSTAVMATERGTKSVAQAIELSEQAGDAIDRLSDRVTESSEAAMQITASNQQQLSGMDQLSQAMESINDATQQNLDGVKQIEDAIKNLETMAQTLKTITASYKI